MKYKIPWGRPWIDKREHAAVKRVLDREVLSSGDGGPEVEALEQEFAAFHGYNHAVAVSSGMSGLRIVTGGHKNWSVTGATFPPVLALAMDYVDKDKQPYLPGHGVIATLLYDSNNIHPWTDFHGVADWCEGVGTHPSNRCDAVYSFYPNKQMTSCEGGMICTQLYEKAKHYRTLRNNGRDGTSWNCTPGGMNARMSEVHAAIARSQLARLPEILRLRKKLFQHYDSVLDIRRPVPSSIFSYVYETDHAEHRRSVEIQFQKSGIEYRRTFTPHDTCVAWQDWYERTLQLPFYTRMSRKEVDCVCRAIHRA